MNPIEDTICDKVFKNGPSKICGRQPSKILKGYGLLNTIYFVDTFTTEKTILHNFNAHKESIFDIKKLQVYFLDSTLSLRRYFITYNFSSCKKSTNKMTFNSTSFVPASGKKNTLNTLFICNNLFWLLLACPTANFEQLTRN